MGFSSSEETRAAKKSIIFSCSKCFLSVHWYGSVTATNLYHSHPPSGWWHISVTPGYGTRFPDFTPLQSAPHPPADQQAILAAGQKSGGGWFSQALVGVASGGQHGVGSRGKRGVAGVTLGPASNTSHSIRGHPCAGASGLQGPDDLSPLRTPLSESGFAGGRGGRGNDRVPFGEKTPVWMLPYILRIWA